MSEKFNPNEHLRTLTRRKKVKDTTGEHWIEETHAYLDVKWRIVWFRQMYPEGFIQTVEVEVNDKFARIEAIVYDKDPAHGGKRLGMGRRCIWSSDFKDYLEKCDTQSVGRALAVAGFGTQFCEEFDEEDTFADAPIEAKPVKPHSAPATSSATSTPGTAPSKIPVTTPSEKAGFKTDTNSAYDAALRKGLSRNDTDLLVMAKYQKLSIEELSNPQIDEFVAGIKSTSVDKLREFVDRYKATLELKNTAVA